MAITYKKVFRKNPIKSDGSGKYYPQLIVWGKPATLATMAYQMKDLSSLSLGDIQSVLSNFVTVMRRELYAGHSVSIDGFGVFSLSATTEGTENKEDCKSENIKSVRINFRAASSIRPSVAATRAEDAMEFIDLESQMARLGLSVSEDASTDSGSGDNGSTEGDDENLYG